MPWPPPPVIDAEMRRQCYNLILTTARAYDVPPAYIVAHIRSVAVDEARKQVMRVMILEFGLLRQQVATIFGRDRRRIRKSVIGV